MRHIFSTALFILLITIGVMAHANTQTLNFEDYPIIKLRSLDKVTARTMNIEAKVGSTIRFGDIMIKVQACRKPPPIEKNEAAGFLQIYQSDTATESNDNKIVSPQKWIFSGWMYASSPAISAMDHPIYDVWVLDCLGRDPEPLPPPEEQVPVATDSAEEEEKTTTNTQIETSPDAAQTGAPETQATPPVVGISPETQPTPDGTEPVTSPPSQNEPSLDEMLQPDKAIDNAPDITTTNEPLDEPINIPPSEPITNENPAPLTAPNPDENSSGTIEGIY